VLIPEPLLPAEVVDVKVPSTHADGSNATAKNPDTTSNTSSDKNNNTSDKNNNSVQRKHSEKGGAPSVQEKEDGELTRRKSAPGDANIDVSEVCVYACVCMCVCVCMLNA
jgi:hypothetical protein